MKLKLSSKYFITAIFITINLIIISWVAYELIFKDQGYSRYRQTSEYSKPINIPKSGRWYSQDQVVLGNKIYTQNCQVCHKPAGTSIKNWKQPFSDGSYPPPPLNGSAHTWHHSLTILLKTINNGGIEVGGKMPAFKNVLTEEEQKAVIAYIQSLWPEEIYRTWASRNK